MFPSSLFEGVVSLGLKDKKVKMPDRVGVSCLAGDLALSFGFFSFLMLF